MLKFGDKIIYMEGVLVELNGEFAALDLKGRLGYMVVPQWMLVHEFPLIIGQEFGWNMSFPEQTAPHRTAEPVEQVASVKEGEQFLLQGKVTEIEDGATGLELTSCKGSFKFPQRMFLCDYEIEDGQPVGWTMTPLKQLHAEPNKKYVSNLDTYLRRQAEMQAKNKE